VWDGKGYFMLTENLVLHGSLLVHPDLPSAEEFALSNGFDVRNYFNWNYQLQNSERLPEGDLQPMFILASPMLSYLGTPFYIIAQAINFSPIQFTAFFLNSIILALSSTVVFAFADEIFRSKKIAFILSIVAAVCSFAWPYATNYFQQPLAGLMIISSCYFLYMASKNRFPYAAFLSGLSLGLLLLAISGKHRIESGVFSTKYSKAHLFCMKFSKNEKSFSFLIGIQQLSPLDPGILDSNQLLKPENVLIISCRRLVPDLPIPTIKKSFL